MNSDIYFFNPTCEMAVANGSTNYMAPALLRRFEIELSTLPLIYCKTGDIILTKSLPDRQFSDRLESAGFRLPTFMKIESVLSDNSMIAIDKGFLLPWGWSPVTHQLLAPLKSGCCNEFLNSPVARWQESHKELFSRKSALNILHKVIIKKLNNILSINDIPRICTTHEQIISLHQRWDKMVVKSPWSSSGRGLQILLSNNYNRTNQQVISGFLKHQGYVAAEPWHAKVIDLSFQFFSYGNGSIVYQGLTSFTTDLSGRYLGNNIQELPDGLSSELLAFINENIPPVRKALQDELILSRYATDYYGWIGIDILIYKSIDNQLLIHPCLEINCRFTMGTIAINLRDRLSDQSTGEFKIFFGKEGEFAEFCSEMIVSRPLKIEHEKLVKGFLPLSPVHEKCCFGAYLTVL